MLSQNVDLLRKAYDAYNREGIGGVLEFLDREVEWRNPPESPNADVFSGHEGVREWQRMVDGAFKRMRFEPERIDELPDGQVLAVVRFRFRAPTDEVDLEVPIAHLVRWRDGKVTAFSMYTSESAARDAARLPPKPR